jgi:NAD(P)-dependent dehydrogenase (short-subunit alcohol dehydrogenase family)
MANESKVALITGANRGLGLETARQLGQKGVTVVVGACSLKMSEQTASKLKAEGVDAYPVQLDVTNTQDRTNAARFISDRFGKPDILINDAGIGSIVPKTIESYFGTNLFSIVATTLQMLPLLKKSEDGRIVNLSSMLGSLTLHADPNSPIANFKVFAHDASKTALNAFTHASRSGVEGHQNKSEFSASRLGENRRWAPTRHPWKSGKARKPASTWRLSVPTDPMASSFTWATSFPGDALILIPPRGVLKVRGILIAKTA